MVIIYKNLIVLVILLFFIRCLSAQSADTILINYFKATGGLEKIRDIKTSFVEVQTETFGSYDEDIWYKQPINGYQKSYALLRREKTRAELYTENELAGIHYYNDGYWLASKKRGVLDYYNFMDKEIVLSQSMYDFYTIWYFYTHFPYKLIGTQKIAEKNLFIIEFDRPQGTVQYMFESQTFLLKMGKYPDGDIFYEDYREFEGLYLPTKILTYKKGKIFRKTELKAIKLNLNLPDSLFVPKNID